MTFDSLDRLLKALEQQPGWSDYRRYRCLCQVWDKMIEPRVVPHTRPLSIQRNILWVATSSAVWAQHLSLQRHSLLKKINIHLVNEPIADLRFSSAQWHDFPLLKETFSDSSHPSDIDLSAVVSQTETETSTAIPEKAFHCWTQVIEARSQGLPLCPQCHCPTPPGELKRWSLCMHCATQQWRTNFSSSE